MMKTLQENRSQDALRMLRRLDNGALKLLERHCIGFCNLDDGGCDYPHCLEAKQLMIKNALRKKNFGLVQMVLGTKPKACSFLNNTFYISGKKLNSTIYSTDDCLMLFDGLDPNMEEPHLVGDRGHRGREDGSLMRDME